MTHVAVGNLSVELKDRVVINDVSFGIATPGLVIVAGPNGAGKSTLLRALAGVVEPSRGTLEIGGRMLKDMPAAERARLIGYLPQERTVHWPLRAREIVALGRLPHMAPGGSLAIADQKAIDAALTDMEATALSARPVLELSGGERARILIARVLAQQPAVILADEPTSGLDPHHQWALFERLEAAANQGMRIIIALHDLALASRFATHVLLLVGGRLVASGRPSNVLSPERLADVFGIAAVNVEHDGRNLVVPVGLTPATRVASAP